MCHDTPGDSTLGKYVVTIPRFDSGIPEEWSPEGTSRTEYHYWSTHVQVHESVLKGDAKAG